MSAEEIRKYDPEDLELKSIMGDKFRDDTHEAHSEPVKAEFPKVSENTAEYEDEAEDEEIETTPCLWKKNRTFFDKLTECAKTAIIFGGLNGLLFYWEKIGLMAESVAVPSMCVCAALFGLGIGKVVGKK